MQVYRIPVFKYLFSVILAVVCGNILVAQAPTGAYKLRKVVIDAGHGGHDPGVVGKKAKEKDIVLPVALEVGKLIRTNHPEVEVVYTRNEDVFVPVRERSNIANKCNADLFISIHANSVSNRKHTHVGGSETFVMGVDDSDRNMEVAKRENAVITYEEDYVEKYEGYDPNSPESFIIFSLMQNVYLDQSILLASMVQDEMIAHTPIKNNRGVRQEPLLVLWHTAMPSILIEIGFLSNPNEEALLMKKANQDSIAKSIADAFSNYKAHCERVHKASAAEEPEPAVTPSTNTPKTTFYAVQIFTVSAKKAMNDPAFAGLDNIRCFPERRISY